MPITKSAQKALRQNIRRHKLNSQRQTVMKISLKEFQKLVREKKTGEAKKYLTQVYKNLDKLTKVNFIKSGKAKRLKSRLAKKLAVQ